jgi:hypothetical protein
MEGVEYDHAWSNGHAVVNGLTAGGAFTAEDS